jgi:aspartate/methionine/tyrosine aminotransferase
MPIPAAVAKWGIRLGIVQHLPNVRRLMGDGVSFLRFYSSRTLEAPNVQLRATQEILNAAQSPDVIDLSVGAPDLDISLRQAAEEIGGAVDGYPPLAGLPELRQGIARRCAERNGLDFDADSQVLVCNGASQGIGLFLDTFVDPGERVATFDPSYYMYRLAAQHRRARITPIATRLEDGFTQVEDAELRRVLRWARVLFVNSPCNPTGGVFPRSMLERIAWWCKRYDVLIFSDEVYDRFVYGVDQASIASFADARDRTVTANSFSKSHGMAAYRVGYVAGARHLVRPMLVGCLASTPFVSVPAQRLALMALAQPADLWSSVAREYVARRDRAAGALSTAGVSFDLPRGAFYLWISIDSFASNASDFARELLAEHRVLVMPGDTLGKRGGRFVRVSYAGATPLLDKGIDRLTKFLAAKRSGIKERAAQSAQRAA